MHIIDLAHQAQADVTLGQALAGALKTAACALGLGCILGAFVVALISL